MMISPRILLQAIAFTAAMAATAALAQRPEVGAPLAPVEIVDGGSIELQGDQLAVAPWASATLQGQPAYIQHLAARTSVEGLNKALDDALEVLGYSSEQLLSVAVVNLDDALWGTSGLVASQLRKNKQRYPDAVIVQDARGLAREVWQLEPKNAAVIITSAQGEVLFFQEGQLSAADIDALVRLVKKTVEQGAAP